MGRHKRYRQASILLMKWFRSHYDFNETDIKKSRSNTREVLNILRRQIAETIKAKSLKRAEKLTEQIKLNDKKLMKDDRTNRIYKNHDGTNQLQKFQIFRKPILPEPISQPSTLLPVNLTSQTISFIILSNIVMTRYNVIF